MSNLSLYNYQMYIKYLYTFISSYNILYNIDTIWMFLLKQSLKTKLEN